MIIFHVNESNLKTVKIVGKAWAENYNNRTREILRTTTIQSEKYWAKIMIRINLSQNTEIIWIHLNHASLGIEPWQPVHWSERGVERIFLLLKQTGVDFSGQEISPIQEGEISVEWIFILLWQTSLVFLLVRVLGISPDLGFLRSQVRKFPQARILVKWNQAGNFPGQVPGQEISQSQIKSLLHVKFGHFPQSGSSTSISSIYQVIWGTRLNFSSHKSFKKLPRLLLPPPPC